MAREMIMNRIFALLLCGLFLAAPSGAQESGVVPNRYIVKFKSANRAPNTQKFKTSLQVKNSRKLDLIGAEVWETTKAPSETAISSMRKDAAVEYIEPVYKIAATAASGLVPNDPYFESQWGLRNTGQNGGLYDADIDAPEAWSLSTGAGSDVVVAVIDTGVDYHHPDLAANIWTNTGEIPNDKIDNDGNGYIDDVHGWDFVNNDNDPIDDDAHGTHCSGIIAAAGNNGVGIAGVNWGARIMALKILDAYGDGTTENAIKAIEYAVKMGVKISNNSWGMTSSSNSLKEAIRIAGESGHLFVAASGNYGYNLETKPIYPAGYDLGCIISVTAVNQNNTMPGWADYGSISVDLGAPGDNIFSTVIDNQYMGMSGTSMAAPHVTGAASLVWALHPGYTNAQVKSVILGSVDQITALAGKTVTGGKLNLFKALGGEEAPVAFPSISINPNSFSENLLQDQTVSRVLHLGNPVEGTELNYSLSIRKASAQKIAVESFPFDPDTYLAAFSDAPKNSTSPSVAATEQTIEKESIPGGLKVLLAPADDASQIAAYLLTDPDIAQVDYFDATSSTPSVDRMKTYDAVITWPNWPYADKTAMGNNLAEYADAGGRVILGSWCWYTIGNSLGGLIMTPNYNPFKSNGGIIHNSAYVALGTYDHSNPLMQGVSSLVDNYRDYLKLNSGDKLIASWTGGESLLGKKSGKNVVYINAYPGDGHDWSDDLEVLVRNAVVGSQDWGIAWLKSDTYNGTIQGGSSADITLTFDSTSLPTGDYYAKVSLSTNDPSHPSLIVPAHLGVVSTIPRTVPDAVEAGWIDPYAYVYNSRYNDYTLIEPDDDIQILPWQGFWIGVKTPVDILFSKGETVDATGFQLENNTWRFFSCPILPSGSRDLGTVFTPYLGKNEETWRVQKWDYTSAGSGTTGYRKYPETIAGAAFPELLPGRGFWIKQIKGGTISVAIEGTTVDDQPGDYELKLPVNGSSGITAHMIGNPYATRAIRWGDLKLRAPSTASPVGKPAARASSIDKWYVGIKLEADNGQARDMYNRAGVITTEGVDNTIYNALDLVPPGSYVNVRLSDPSNPSRSGLAYDYRATGRDEYQWEIRLSTNLSSAPVRLSLDNLENVPEGIKFTLKDLNTGETISLSEDRALPLTLAAGNTHVFLLTARTTISEMTGVEEARPASFGLIGANPNPFNPSTTVHFTIEKAGAVRLNVYTIHGQLASRLAEGRMAAGKHSLVWNANGCSSGVYLVVLESGGKRDAMKISLVK